MAGITNYSINEIKNRLAPLLKEEGLQIVLLFGSVLYRDLGGIDSDAID